MSGDKSPEKIAILGGGIAALVTAFELTRDKDWKTRFESVTVYQMGWRLGGKCASSRGPHMRIEEHGIHGFLGSYYNALPLFQEVYKELARKPGEPIATFEEAIRHEDFGTLWERKGRAASLWEQRFPANTHEVSTNYPPALERSFTGVLEGVLAMVAQMIFGDPLSPRIQACLQGRAAKWGAELARTGPHPKTARFHRFWKGAQGFIYGLVKGSDHWRRIFIVLDSLVTMVCGAIAEDVAARGFDHMDEENYSDWFARHGAHPETIRSPVAANFINMTYQYPKGDTSLSPQMAAGAYVRWALRASGYMGAFIWVFAAGTGETLIAPLYRVLERRGVKFEFFHKVEKLHLSADQRTVASVDFDLQATLKDPSTPYDPLFPVDGLDCWPEKPKYDLLVEGPAMAAIPDLDLESYWSPWANRTDKTIRTLKAGADYDKLVFAISIGAIPFLCEDLLRVRQDWRDMVAQVPALQTQAMQIWLDRTQEDLGWTSPMKPGEMVFATTYINPNNGLGELHDLIPWERWPKDNTPKSLWYFCGLMNEDETPPPFTDTNYPKRQRMRVKAQCIQYLQASIGFLIPGATTDASSPPGDLFGLNFNLLTDTRAKPGVGMERFDEQFWRANIDPTERYVATPPGSTKYRLKAWGSGFDNLVLAGDWIDTGINVGSVEGTVMSGKLASHAVCGSPALADILGYEI